MRPGTYPGLSMAEYHAIPAASNSQLTRLLKSPAHLLAYRLEPFEQTDAQRVGDALHAAVLEPDTFEARFAVAEQCAADTSKGSRCANTGSVRRDGVWFCGVRGHDPAKGEPGDELGAVLTSGQMHDVLCMRDAVLANPTVRKILAAGGDIEVTRVWLQEVEGGDPVLCKARADFWCPTYSTVLDLKTTMDASLREFERAIWKWGYHRGAALYRDGFDAEHYVHCAIEKTRPWAHALYRLREDAVEAGMHEITALLKQYRQCVETNQWPGYPVSVQDIALPPWAWAISDERAVAA